MAREKRKQGVVIKGLEQSVCDSEFSHDIIWPLVNQN